jgi:HPr kinase/phosphorylase
MPKINVTQLFEDNRDKLQLAWAAGHEGGAQAIDSEKFRQSREGLIGHLNFIHPNWVQVFAQPELTHLEALDPAMRQQMLQRLASSGLACLIVAGGEPVPPSLQALADATQIALFSSPVPSVELMAVLRPYLMRALADCVTMHGVLLDVLGLGVLLTGNSGVGKSELALELISRGSGLVADDVVELYRVGPETIEGRCPSLLKNYLEVRGLGVLDIRTIFGEAAVRPRKNLKLVVHLEKPAAADKPYIERLPLKPGVQDIMGISIHKVTIPVAAGRNLAVLTEAAVRNYVLQLRGIDSTRAFIERQEQQMNGGK